MSRRTTGRIAQLAVLAVLCAAAPAGCAGDDGGEPDARTDARDVVPDAPGGDVPTDLGTDATEPPLEWVEPHGEELPSGSVITPEAGGTIVGDDGRVMVSFPPGAVAVPTTVTLGPLAVTPPTDASDLGLAIDVDARDPEGEPVTQLAGFAYLYFLHDALDVLPSPAADLVVHAHDDGAASGDDDGWSALPTASSPDGGSSMARTDHFSGFGLYAPALTGMLGCKPGGGCLTSINDSNPISSMGMDGQGNLYFMHPNGPYIYRLPAGGGRGDVEIFFNAADAYSGTWLYLNRIAVSDRTGDVFLLRHEQVFRIGQDKSWTLVYPPEGGETVVIPHHIQVNPVDGALWVQCRDDGKTDTLRRIDPGSGKVLATVPFDPNVRPLWPSDNAWTFDAQGRLFALHGWSLLMLDDPLGQALTPWTLVAEGFVGNRRSMTTDGDGNVYVAAGPALCPAGSSCVPEETPPATQIAVVNGTPAFPNARIAGLTNPGIVVAANDRLLVSGGDRITILPLDRRDPLDAQVGGVATPSAGSLSGRGSFVKLTGALASSPVHHAVWLGGIRLALAQALPGELRFTIPSFDFGWERAAPYLADLGRGVRMTLPEGEVTVRVGPDTRVLGAVQTPEPGHYKPVYYTQMNGTGSCYPIGGTGPDADAPWLEVATGEWVYWPAPGNAPEYGPWGSSQAWSVTSNDGLFSPWVAANDGPWLAVRFPTPGQYTFRMERGAETLDCRIRVSDGGAPNYRTDITVDPAVGGTFFSNGLRMRIPPGALPGTQPYTLRLTTTNDPAPASDAPAPGDPPQRHRHWFNFTPQPDRLSGTLRFGIPDGGGGDDLPRPAFFDNGAADGVPEAWQMSAYVPIAFDHDGAGGYVDLVLPAGEYDAPGIRDEAASSARAARRPVLGPRVLESVVDAGVWLGNQVNDIGANLWWKVGLPNEKIADEHFTVLYNTRAGMTEDRALAVHEGLSMAHTRFRTWGYEVPGHVIVTLDRDLAEEGSASGLGRLGHWNASVAGWLAFDDLTSVSAHELFHIIQYENMSYAARALKSQWKWFLEGSAVWAEMITFPESNSAKDYTKAGSDFVHLGLDGLGAASDDQAYAAAGLIDHLEKQHEGAVLEILQAVGVLTAPDDALRTVVGDVPAFLEGFALAYFGGQEAPYSGWDLSKAFLPPRVLANPSTPLINRGMPPESIVAVRAATDPGTPPPTSYADATGSVLRASHMSEFQRTLLLDGTGKVKDRLDGKSMPQGIALAKAETFTPANPLVVVHVNGDPAGSFARDPSVVFEVPTLDQVTPATFHYASAVDLTATGGGFGDGAAKGSLVVFYQEHATSQWTDASVTARLPANTVTPMDVPVVVRHKAGVDSNVRTVEATGD